LADVVGTGDAALRLVRFEALAGLLLLVRAEDRFAAEFDASRLGVGPSRRFTWRCGRRWENRTSTSDFADIVFAILGVAPKLERHRILVAIVTPAPRVHVVRNSQPGRLCARHG